MSKMEVTIVATTGKTTLGHTLLKLLLDGLLPIHEEITEVTIHTGLHSYTATRTPEGGFTR